MKLETLIGNLLEQIEQARSPKAAAVQALDALVRGAAFRLSVEELLALEALLDAEIKRQAKRSVDA